MTRQTYHLEMITPCFCAGADPAIAEIRAPSIRGQLRWWFRVLGGTSADEAAVFGSVAGNDGTASSVRIAISDYKSGPVWVPPAVDQNTPQSYTWHFARESGKSPNSGRTASGPRWQAKGAVPPFTCFTLIVTQMRQLSPARRKLFDFSLSAFLCFGTIGLRATRGLGAFTCKEAKPWRDLLEPLVQAGFGIALRQQPETFSSWELALKDWSAWLRYNLRAPQNGGVKADTFSALGGITPRRQASAIRFRPIKLSPVQFTWLALEAPHGRVLGQKTSLMLSPTLFEGPAPSAPSTRR